MPGSAPDSAERVAAILAALDASSRPERAVGEAAYLKSSLVHLGVAVPEVRRIVRAHLRAQPVDHDQLLDLCRALWADPVHEQRLAAIEAMTASPTSLSPADLPVIESMLRECRTWALVDPLAGWVTAEMAARDADTFATLDRWVADGDFWIRRSAVLALRTCLKDGRELDRFVRYSDLLLDEREFFIRKVIGWVAREIGARDPAFVSAWLRPRLARVSGVTMREAVKRLPDADELLVLWKRAR